MPLRVLTDRRLTDHLEDAGDAVGLVGAVLRRRRRGRVRAEAVGRLWDAREVGVPLAVLATHLVDYEIERRDHVEAETAGARLIKRVARGADDLTGLVVFELQAEGEVRVEGQGLLAELDVVGRDELLILPSST